ncbi:peroxiredoxin family protein [Ferviditalea candida]|uniref:TlpA disulfide reductase family protein n=1 Tax=Ferviditalea candida TaxID=3108399 RepID=A0ABU5ZJM5_9BACL|nr:TlpA disulfide reductase family protein [Paenibacillaceae bacterium T2]
MKKNKMMNAVAIVFLLGLVLWGVYDYAQKGKDQAAGDSVLQNKEVGLNAGNIAPNFKLSKLDGEAVSLSDLKGKKVILNFWATWCPPCQMEMPHMEKIYKEYEKQGVVVLGVNLTFTEQDPAKVPVFVQDYGLSFPIALDKKGEVSDLYAVVGYPTTYIIDSRGVISKRYQGAINYDIMRSALAGIQ